jgi:hypothetical protein
MTLLLALWLAGCSGSSEPTIVCPEKTELKDVRPVSGGRTMWCEKKNGVREGPWVEYRADGSKAAEGRYERNRRQGRFTWWHTNGKVLEETDFLDGKKDGESVTYDDQGTVLKRETWVKGELQK